MSKRRILILTNRVPYPLKDGGNLAMNAMIEGYRQDGWRVYLLAMNTTRHPVNKEQSAEVFKDLEGFSMVDVDNKVRAATLLWNLLFSRQPNHAHRFFKQEFRQELEEVLLRFNPDVIQIESIFLTTYMPYIRTFSSAVTVLRLHNIEYQVWKRLANDTKGMLKKFFLKNLAKRMKRFEEDAWKQFDLLLPITEIDAKMVAQAGIKTDMVVAPFGINTGTIHRSAATEKWNAYHLGAMDWLPNADAINWFLTGIWPAIHKALPDFEFYFAGRGMMDVFKKLKVKGVFCMGEVPDAAAFIADKKILVVPLRSGGGIRVKILEAMAAGKMVISTNVGMQGIDAIPGVHYLAANNQEEFINAIQWCLSNKNEAEMIATDAIKLIKEQYDLKLIMQNIDRAINMKLVQNSK